MNTINLNLIDNLDNHSEIINFDYNLFFPLKKLDDNKLIDIKKIIIYFPFKKLYYLSENKFFLYINKNNKTIELIIKDLINLILKYEGNNYTFIEGVKVKENGKYNLSCINFERLKYNYNQLYYNNNLSKNYNIYFLNFNLFY